MKTILLFVRVDALFLALMNHLLLRTVSALLLVILDGCHVTRGSSRRSRPLRVRVANSTILPVWRICPPLERGIHFQCDGLSSCSFNHTTTMHAYVSTVWDTRSRRVDVDVDDAERLPVDGIYFYILYAVPSIGFIYI